MSEMDAIDRKQQEEIDKLHESADTNKTVDAIQTEQIKSLRFFVEAILIFMVLATFLNWFGLFYILSKIK